jgi:predicted ATPase with chaperone activity
VARAFADLCVGEQVLKRLGRGIASGQAMFLFGDPGNGKTSLAERITRTFGDAIWIPHTLYIDGHIVKLLDPAMHEVVEKTPEKLDRRWVRVKRPTIIAGGELTLDMLEVNADPRSNVSEAPLQFKANGGTLVIDDFGRGKLSPKELLNRWIYPLEKRMDFLLLPDGRKITSPFDCLLVFSTNLQPRDLADEAFLRRIPHKIRVPDPTEENFRMLLASIAGKMNIQVSSESVNHLLERHYRGPKRAMRFCHPRDLLGQVANLCAFEGRELVATPSDWDEVAENYFGAT